MTNVIDLEEAKFNLKVKKSFKNWISKFKENFNAKTELRHISTPTLAFLARGKDESVFYIYDLIMNLRDLGSALEFGLLSPNQKIFVIDQYLFLLDQIRFECMKRLQWLESYPAEGYPIAILVRDFEKIAPLIQAKSPVLSPQHPGYEKYENLSPYDKDTFIRRLIPKALEKIKSYSVTL